MAEKDIVWGPACKFLQTEYANQSNSRELTGGTMSRQFMLDLCKEAGIPGPVEFIELAHIKLHVATRTNDMPGYHIWWEREFTDFEEVDFS